MDITKELSSTAYIMGEFMSANDITIEKLAEESGVPVSTVRGIPDDESALEEKVASALSSLIPDLSSPFLMSYDEEYRKERKGRQTAELR